MKLYDEGKIIAGIVVFLIVATFPFWYGRGKGGCPAGNRAGHARDPAACGEAMRGGYRFHAGQPHETSRRLGGTASSGEGIACIRRQTGRYLKWA